MTEHDELLALRELEKAVRADKIGCIAVVSRYDSKGAWLRDEFKTTNSALARLDALRNAAPPQQRIYISGPMTGLPDFNFPAFNAEAERLRAMGYDVINPVDINPDTTTPYNECLRNDLKALLDCDTIAMLDGWMNSNGAHLEMHIAHRVGIKVIEAREIRQPATVALAVAQVRQA